MRILVLTEKYPPDVGGLAVSAHRLAQLLAGAGHVAHVLAPDAALTPGQIADSQDGPVLVHRFGTSQRSEDTLADWFDTVRVLHKSVRFDLLHAYYAVAAGFVAVYSARTLGLPSVASARGNDLDRAAFDAGKAAHVLYTLANAGAVTANSSDLVRKAQALAPGRTVTLVPNGVDASLFCPSSRDIRLAASLGLDGRAVLGFVGEARAKKGLGTLLLACARVGQQQPAALLLVGGVRKGEDTALLEVFRRHNPRLPLVVVPYLESKLLPAYYGLMDVLILPSLRDGLPNALLEGMACARPVVASVVGGIPDAVDHRRQGLLVPPGDPEACAAVILELLANSSLARELGAAARKAVLERFTPGQELAANLAIYRDLIGGGA